MMIQAGASAEEHDELSGERKLLGCPSCGLMQESDALQAGMIASCCRCGAILARAQHAPVALLFPLVIAALLLCTIAMSQPIFIVHAAGRTRETPVEGPVYALYDENFAPLAIVTGLFTIVAPLLWLGSYALVLGALYAGRNPPWLGRMLRHTQKCDKWAMPDVFLMGGFVAYTRLQAVSTVAIGSGGWAYVALAICSVIIRARSDNHFLWQEVMPDTERPPPGRAICCGHCGMVLPDEREGEICPRCQGRVHRRHLSAAGIAAALVVASYLLYIPANLLPILSVVRFGREQTNTIFSGGIELLNIGMWPLAIIVFMASIVVPVSKLLGLSWCLLALRRKSDNLLVARTRLHRFIGAIGRWSNIDVFMIGLLAALVQFGNLTTIVPEPGGIAFAAVVILTMLASHAFDARLMWDAAGEKTTE